MKKQKQGKNQGEISALLLKGYQLIFFRRHLGLEKTDIEIGKIRNDYLFKTLVPAIDSVDLKVMQIRDKYAERLPSGQIKTRTEDGQIEYGENTEVARAEFEAVISEDLILPITDKEQFAICRDVFRSLKQELNETDLSVYLEVLGRLNSVQL